MESLEEIESKLSLYQSQLEQVNQLLETDSDNSQFLSLKDDLEKVISLTQTLLLQYYPQHGSPLNLRKRGREEANLSGDKDDDDQYNLSDLEADGDDETLERPVGTIATPLPVKTGPIKVNDHIEVIGGERSFAGVIIEVINSTEFKVKYYEFADEVSLPLSSIQRITPGPYVLQYDDIHNDHLTVGTKCQCKYATDQQYYDATITEKTKNGYIVTYTGYGNSEEVPIEYIRPPVLTLEKQSTTATATGAATTTTTNNNNNNKNTNGNKVDEKKSQIIPIPANLKILPTDTEEEKQRKKKKIKAIKNKNRIISQEEDVAQVQQSWKKFIDKVRYTLHTHNLTLGSLTS